jgi:raffinose/stachyose/melibiose transport system permease protein
MQTRDRDDPATTDPHGRVRDGESGPARPPARGLTLKQLATIRRSITFTLFIAPAFLLFTVFIVYPMLSAMKFSFFNWNGLLQGDFVGLANFQTLFTRYPYNEQVWSALGHNAYFFVLTMVVQNGIGLVLAVLLDRGIRARGFFRNAVFLPHLLPTVVVGFLWYLMLNPQFGVINNGLEAIGLSWLAHPWLGDPTTAFTTIVFVNAWSWIGFPMVIFLANLASIPDEYDEAAQVDGANSWQRFRYVSLPLLVPSLTIVTVLTFIGNFNAFDLVYSMAGSEASPGGSTDVLGLLFYRIAFDSADPNAVGVGNALAVLMFFLVFGVSNVWLRMFKRKEIAY